MLLGMIGQGIVAATFVALAAATVLLGAGLAFKPARATQVLKAGVLTLRFGFVLATAAVVLLEFALLTDRFELVYVARNSWTAMAWPYKIGALWSGQAGSLLLWLWLLALYAALLSWRSRPAEDQGQGLLLPALAVLAGQATFFALLVTFVENPFAVQLPAPADGRGMNPLLQNPSMLAHPLLVYGGFVGMAVPFAFAVAALWRRRVDAAWLRRTRRWTLVAWLLLSAGMLVGAQWSYIELGWGGYWGWDPVENASLLPWLTATAFLHSAWVQERRGMLKTWNLGLIMATYALTILGTLITRSGVLASVHAFAQSPIGPWFVGYLGAILALSCYLLLDRHRQLRREPRFESYLSREVGFHLNNWLLLAITFAVLWGTLFPIISRFRGVDVTVGPPFYNRVAGPLLLGLIALMGIGPVLAWRKSSPAAITAALWAPAFVALACLQVLVLVGVRQPPALIGFPLLAWTATLTLAEIARGVRARSQATGEAWPRAAWNLVRGARSRYGGYLVHLGILVMAAGILASSNFSTEMRLPLRLGQSVTVGPYTVQFLGLEREVEGGVPAVVANLAVRDPDGRLLAYVRPEKRFFPGFVETMGPTTEIAVLSTLKHDFYAVLAGFDEGGAVAGFEFLVRPLVSWIWFGGYLLIGGTLFALWPSRRRRQFAHATEPVLAELNELELDRVAGKLDALTYEQQKRRLVALLERLLAQERELEAEFAARVRARRLPDGAALEAGGDD